MKNKLLQLNYSALSDISSVSFHCVCQSIQNVFDLKKMSYPSNGPGRKLFWVLFFKFYLEEGDKLSSRKTHSYLTKGCTAHRGIYTICREWNEHKRNSEIFAPFFLLLLVIRHNNNSSIAHNECLVASSSRWQDSTCHKRWHWNCTSKKLALAQETAGLFGVKAVAHAPNPARGTGAHHYGEGFWLGV